MTREETSTSRTLWRGFRLRATRGLKREYTLVVPLLILVIVLSIISPAFRTTDNVIVILRQIAVVGVLACGATVVMIGGGIDLSNADQLVFYSVVFALLVGPLNAGLGLAIAIPLALGLVMGLVNGGIIAGLGLPPFLTTLGMLLLLRGLSFVSTGFNDVQLSGITSFLFIGSGTVGPIPAPIIILAAVAATTWFLLSGTTFGRSIYAVGGNELAARLAGLPVSRIKVATYVVSGLCAGIGGILLASEFRYATPRYGLLGDLLLGSLAAVVIGGTSLSGGRGSIGGTLLGAALIGIVSNALGLLNVPGYFQLLVVGTIVLAAVGVNSMIERGQT